MTKLKFLNKDLAKTAIYAGVLTIGVLGFTEMAYAKFDINAGVDAAVDPLIAGIKEHWGKAVALTGSGAALLGEGDGRQRAIRAIIACGSSSAAILGMMAMLT